MEKTLRIIKSLPSKRTTSTFNSIIFADINIDQIVKSTLVIMDIEFGKLHAKCQKYYVPFFRVDKVRTLSRGEDSRADVRSNRERIDRSVMFIK